MTTRRTLPWPRILVEGVVIVVSILLAFGLQAWWEGDQERQEERAYLESLTRDFQQTRLRAEEHIEANEQTLANASRLLEVIGQSDDVTATDSTSILLEGSFWISSFAPVLGTYRDMVNSGDLRLLENEELRIALSQFEEQTEHVDLLDQTLWEHWLRFDLPFLKDHYVLSDVYEGYRSNADRLGVDVPAVTYGEPRFEPDREALRSREFYNILVARTVAHQDAIVSMKTTLVQIDRVLRLAEAELARFGR